MTFFLPATYILSHRARFMDLAAGSADEATDFQARVVLIRECHALRKLSCWRPRRACPKIDECICRLPTLHPRTEASQSASTEILAQIIHPELFAMQSSAWIPAERAAAA